MWVRVTLLDNEVKAACFSLFRVYEKAAELSMLLSRLVRERQMTSMKSPGCLRWTLPVNTTDVLLLGKQQKSLPTQVKFIKPSQQRQVWLQDLHFSGALNAGVIIQRGLNFQGSRITLRPE